MRDNMKPNPIPQPQPNQESSGITTSAIFIILLISFVAIALVFMEWK